MTAKKERDNNAVFETMPIPRALFTMAVPTIIGQLVVLVYSLADTFYMGRTNNPLMVAGASLILPVYNICISIAGLAGTGGGTLISRLLGAGKQEQAGKGSAFWGRPCSSRSLPGSLWSPCWFFWGPVGIPVGTPDSTPSASLSWGRYLR